MLLKIFVAILLLMFHLPTFAAALNESSWDIDKFMKFQIAFLPEDNPRHREPTNCDILCNYPKPLYKPNYKPDISNINLANFLKLGFDIPNPGETRDQELYEYLKMTMFQGMANPKDPHNYNLYLKLYKFPTRLDNTETIKQFINEYKIDTLPTAQYLETYIQQKKNLQIKLAVINKSNYIFTKDHNMPKLHASSIPAYLPYFNSHIPFYSLYLVTKETKPHFSSDDEKANFSTHGITSFYNELLKTYRQKLQELNGIDNKYYYFIDKKDFKNTKKLVVLSFPKEFLVFENWRDLPMPQDPKNIYLTGLLLIYHTEYSLKTNSIPTQIPLINSARFQNLFAKINTKVLEIGSVVYLNKSL